MLFWKKKSMTIQKTKPFLEPNPSVKKDLSHLALLKHNQERIVDNMNKKYIKHTSLQNFKY